MPSTLTNPIAAAASRWPDDCGLLLVGHGSREAVGAQEFLALAERLVAALPAGKVEPCFLEFVPPQPAEAVRLLAARGVRQIVAAPVLLFAAGHAQRDLPAVVACAAEMHRGIRVVQGAHLGCHRALLELSAERFAQALATRRFVPPQATARVLVGRGSYEPTATEEMQRFAALGHNGTAAAHTEVGFLSMAEPKLATVLEQLARGPWRRIVVQPHLLFGGVLADRCAAIVDDARGRHPAIEWLLADRLGAAPQVVEALLDRALSAAVAARESPKRGARD